MFRKKEEKKHVLLKLLGLAGGVALGGYMGNKVFNKIQEENPYRMSRYFIVFQNSDFEEERDRARLAVPFVDRAGNRQFHWDNIEKLERGDMVFSIVNRRVVSLNMVKNGFYIESESGQDLRVVDLFYDELSNPLDIDLYIDDILKLSPNKYGPFDRHGNGNGGYIFEAGEKLGKFLLNTIINEQLV